MAWLDHNALSPPSGQSMHVRRSHVTFIAFASALALGGCAVEETDIAAPAPSEATATPAAQKAEITYKTVRVRKAIPYSKDVVKSSSLDKGEVVTDQEGQPGVRVRVLRVAFQDGVEIKRSVVKTFVKQAPVTEVKMVGTHEEPPPEPTPSDCDSNYAEACVPIASDVDCAGGSGDGPEYVEGPVTVVGDDVYDLNRDDDNIACDS